MSDGLFGMIVGGRDAGMTQKRKPVVFFLADKPFPEGFRRGMRQRGLTALLQLRP